MLISPENTIPISAETLALETAKKLNLLNGQPTWDSDGNIYIDNTPERQAVVDLTIANSRQNVITLTNQALRFEANALKLTRNENIYFHNMGEYINYLDQQSLLRKDNDPVKRSIAFQSLLTHHWSEFLRQITGNEYGITTFNEFCSPNARRFTRWNTITYLEELERGAEIYDAKKGILPNDINQEIYTPYATHSTRAEYSGTRIVEERFIDASRNNFAVSTVVTDTNLHDISFLFKTEDLLKAVPFIEGEGVNNENEIRSYFPVDLRLARSVFPSSIMRKHIPRVGYHYCGYQFNPNKLYVIA